MYENSTLSIYVANLFVYSLGKDSERYCYFFCFDIPLLLVYSLDIYEEVDSYNLIWEVHQMLSQVWIICKILN